MLCNEGSKRLNSVRGMWRREEFIQGGGNEGV
jgi:hypothetical protein